jgi:glycosyltransferase involved in cell wall biosynthesis
VRILYLLTSLDVGGIEKNQVRLSHELIRRGHEVTVVSSGGVLMADLVAAGARHVRAPVAWRSGAGLLAAALAIRRLLKKESFTVVHAMSASANVATLLSRRRRRPWPYITSPMGLQNSDREPLAITRLRNALIAAGADRVLAISPQIHAGLRSVGVPARRIVDCDLVGLEDRFFDPSRDLGHRERVRLGLSEGDSLVTTIGALESRKSHDKFVRMAAHLSKTKPRSRFIVVGEGPERHRLEDLARKLGVAERVSFPGQIADVRPVLAATDVYVKPGIVEGFVGITVLEAMALSRPVAAFETLDVRMVIDDGKTGVLASSGDERVLAAKVDELLTDGARADRLASHGRAVVERRFRIGRIAAALEELYARLSREIERDDSSGNPP